jgi:hypothetical protein
MFASLALCGAATIALIATTARAQPAPRKPVMMALVSSADLVSHLAAPPVEGGPSSDMIPGGARREQICQEIYAHKVGQMAYLEAKFALTPAQAPLFARWKTAALDVARAHQKDCAAHERPDQQAAAPNLIDRLGEEEKMLKRRLADIQTERPALAAFYDSLTPAQKADMTHGHEARMGGRLRRMADLGRGGPHGPGGDPSGPAPMGPPPPQP